MSDPVPEAADVETPQTRARTLRALGLMAAGVAHEFKNLLNPLGLHVELLDRALRKAGAARPESVAAIRDIIQRGVLCIDRLRSFSRLEPESYAAYVDLGAAATEALERVRPLLGERPGLGVQVDLRDAGRVSGHRDELVAAVVDLLINAADACGDRGTITLRTGVDAERAWLQVCDDGPGMSPELEAHAFEPFYSTKPTHGTGLGLANVFATMQRHRGGVELVTAPGRGACFTLSAPRAPGPGTSLATSP